MKPNKVYHEGKLCVFGSMDDNLRLESLTGLASDGRYSGTREGSSLDCLLYVPCPEPEFVKAPNGDVWAIALGVIAREWYPLRETEVDNGLAPFLSTDAIMRTVKEKLTYAMAHERHVNLKDKQLYTWLWKEAEQVIKLTINGSEVELSEESIKSIRKAIK